MKKMTKRTFSLLLSVLMLASALVLSVSAVKSFVPEEGDKIVSYGSYCEETDERHIAVSNADLIEVQNYSCYESGVKEYYIQYYCKACGKNMYRVFTDSKGLPERQPHTEEIVLGKPSTCSEEGLTDGKKCKVCGKVTKEQEVIKKKDHVDKNDDGYCDVCKAETREHCPYCNQAHTGFFGGITRFFHRLLANFGLKQN